MKKLLVVGLLVASSLCASEYKPSLILGLSTSHIFESSEERKLLNEDNHLIGLSYSNQKNDFSVGYFNNSFYEDTYCFNYLRKADTWKKLSFSYGISINYGYEKDYVMLKDGRKYVASNSFVLFDKVGVLPLISIDYKFSKSYKLVGSLLGNVCTTAIRYEF